MNTKNIKPILRYVVKLEARLSCWDGNTVHWQNELTTLHKQIEQLMKLISHYKGDTLEARLFPTGEVEFQGQRYNNPSAAGSAARSTITGRKMSTNGWIFWQVQGNDGTLRTLEQIRDAYAKQ